MRRYLATLVILVLTALVAPATASAWGIDASAATYAGGMKCDGATDDSAAFQAAANAANNPGDIVLLPKGDCRLGSTVQIKYGSTTIQGVGTGQRNGATQAGIGTRLRPLSTFTGSRVLLVQDANGDESTCAGLCRPVYGVTLKDFTIDGQSLPASVDGIYFRSNRGMIDHVHVLNTTGVGIRSRGYTATECTCTNGWDLYDGIYRSVVVLDSGGDGILLDIGSTDMNILQTVVGDSGGSGLHFKAGSLQATDNHFYNSNDYNLWFDNSGSRSKFVGNKIEGASKHGVYFDTCTAGPADVQFIGNGFANNGDGGGSYDHVYYQSSADCGGSSPQPVNRSQLNGNNFSWKSGTALVRYGLRLGSAAKDGVIQGNAFGPASHWAAGGGPLYKASSATGVFASNSGLATELGDLAKSVTLSSASTTVTLAHGLALKPTAVSAQPADAATAALGTPYIAADSTNITLTYPSAAPAGTYKYAVGASVR